MKETKAEHAVIYCRVSSTKQVTRGDGLGSQETRCREYAKYKGYEVVEVFKDDMSGSLIDRPGMKAMLSFLRKRRHFPHAVIIDDISRLARGLETHLQLRAAIASVGAVLESPSIEFGEDSDSQLVENLLASVSQHQRQKNSEQVKNRMRARLMNGYWVFQAPVGYRYERVSGHGKLLVPNEPSASIVREALESFASGRFQIQSEVKRFLEQYPEFPLTRNGYVRLQLIADLLTNPVYAGYVSAKEWKVPLCKGHHEPLISFETFKKIEERLNANAVAPARKDIHLDFPLRGVVVCGECGGPYTSCWSQGRSGSYPYYLCKKRECPSRGKSVRKEVMEAEFEALLRTAQPAPALFGVARKMFTDLWNHRIATSGQRVRTLKAEQAKTEQQIAKLLDRIVETETPSIVSSYENRIRKLEDQKILLGEQIVKCGRPVRDLEGMCRTALDFLGNPGFLTDWKTSGWC